LKRTPLKKKRESNGLNVAELAEKAGISKWYYYKIEAGTRNPTMDQAKRIADILGETVDELFFANVLDETSNQQAATLEKTG
jgi:putative transcriptional regulator